MWSDPIADMLTRIRNGALMRKPQVRMPCSKLKIGIAKVLRQEGYITDFDVIDDGRQGVLNVHLKYGPRGERIIGSIDRVSKPGRREYSGVDDLPRPLQGLGIAIVSTSHGVLSDRQCRLERVGGEVVAVVT